jgi:hypothetical protein
VTGSTARWRADLNFDKFDTENERELQFPVLLVGEGKADASFLMKLMERRGVPNLHYGFPTARTGGFGWTGLGTFLTALQPRAGFREIRAVAIFYDNDNDPAAMFQSVLAKVDAVDLYSVPAAPLELAAADGLKKRVMFVPMPQVGTPGAMETLLLQSAVASAQALACVDTFAICAAIDGWDASHRAKMRLRSLIAAKCKGNSDLTLTNIWGATGNPIDLMHPCFDELVQTVRNVVAAV